MHACCRLVVSCARIERGGGLPRDANKSTSANRVQTATPILDSTTAPLQHAPTPVSPIILPSNNGDPVVFFFALRFGSKSRMRGARRSEHGLH
eukprot:3080221-Rhodomonas_salina.3